MIAAPPGCIPECIWTSLIIMRQLRGIEPTSLDEIEERGNALQKMSSGVSANVMACMLDRVLKRRNGFVTIFGKITKGETTRVKDQSLNR